MGGSKTSSTTEVKIPQEIRDRGTKISTGAMDNYFDPGGDQKYNYSDFAQEGQDRTGQLTPYHAEAGQNVTNAQTSFQPYMDEAADTARGAFAKTSGQGYADAVQDKMNPYESGVLSNIDHNRDVAMNDYKDVAAKSGAFGNDRRAIGEAEIYGDANRQKNDLRYQGYNNAVGQANTAFNQGMTTSDTLAKLGLNTQGAQIAGAQAADQHGNLITAQDQAARDNAVKAYDQPMDVYERLAGINAMQPTNRTSTTTQSQSGGWLGPALGAAGSMAQFAAMPSDENLKEDIQDADPEVVLGAFANVTPKTYRYTDEALEKFPHNTVEGPRTGFTAQEYEDAFGSDVMEKDGYKMMDVPNVLGKLVTAVHGLEKRTRDLKRA